MNIELRNRKKEIIGYTIVSPEDFTHLNQFKWYKNKDNHAQGTIGKMCLLHRYIMIEILKHELTSKNLINHINNNPLDNRRENLRIITPSENARHKRKKENATSKYFGVYKIKELCYSVSMNVNGKILSARYKKEEHAAYQYNLWIDEYNIKSNKNNIETPNDFIKYQKKDKEYPTGISKTKTGEFKVNQNFTRIASISHIGTYATLEQAIENRNNTIYKRDKEIEKKILNTPILYNKDGQCIFKIKENDIIIDEELYYKIIRYSWCIDNRQRIKANINNTFITLPRYIMNYDGDLLIDHINNNILDNRKCNLRIVTAEQNSMNRKKTLKNYSSKYIGVSKIKNTNKWGASIGFKGKKVYLGIFDNEIEAARVRDIATKNYFGEYGKLNFPIN